MKRVLLIAVIIMAGVLMYGEDIVMKNAFYGKINPSKATHDFEIIEHRHFDKEIGEAKLSRPTLTSAGDLIAYRESENNIFWRIIDSDFNTIFEPKQFQIVSRWGNYVYDYSGEDVLLYSRSNDKYLLTAKVSKKSYKNELLPFNFGIMAVVDMDTNYEYNDDQSFYNPFTRKFISEDKFKAIPCKRKVAIYVDNQKIVYGYSVGRRDSIFENGKSGIVFFDYNGTVIKKIALPVVEILFTSDVSPDGNKYVIYGHKNWDDKRRYNTTDYLVYEDGSYVESIYSPGSSFLDANWSADCSMLVGGQQIYDVNSKKYYKSFDDTGAVTNSDRGWFAQTNAGQIVVSDIKTRKPVIIVDVHPETLRWGGNIQISGDGTELICYSNQEFLRIKIKEKKK